MINMMMIVMMIVMMIMPRITNIVGKVFNSQPAIVLWQFLWNDHQDERDSEDDDGRDNLEYAQDHIDITKVCICDHLSRMKIIH